MVRNYDPAPIDLEVIHRIVDTARKAPSAGFSQGQSFVVVTDASMRLSIAEAANEQQYVASGLDPWISRAPVHVVCCTSEAIYRRRYLEPDKLRADGSPIEWPIPYWYFDAGCSAMLLLLAAVNEGLAAGFLGLRSQGFDLVRDLLNIPDDVTPVGLVTIGRPAPDRRSSSLKRGWKPAQEVIHFESWRQAPGQMPQGDT